MTWRVRRSVDARPSIGASFPSAQRLARRARWPRPARRVAVEAARTGSEWDPVLVHRPDPPLTCDETLAVLRQVYVGTHVSVHIFRVRRGGPFATLAGWLSHLELSPLGVTVWLANQPGSLHGSERPPSFMEAGQLYLSRASF